MGDSSSNSSAHPNAGQLRFAIDPGRVARWLTLVVAALAVGHVAIYFVRIQFGLSARQTFGLYTFLNLGKEGNLPTYFSAIIMLIAGLLLVLIAIDESRRRGATDWHWWGLAAGMTFMSVDEAAKFHEGVMGKVMHALVGRGEGVFHYPWYTFYVPLVALLAIVYVPFLLRIPRAYAIRFALAGSIFLAGSLGMEMFEASLRSERAGGGLMLWVYLVEETCEMMGIVLFIHALLRYLGDRGASLRVAFGAAGRDA